MRELLFRGKATCGLNAGKWIYGYYVKDFWAPSSVGHGIIPADRDIGGYCEVYPKTIGQYTEMCDKNGKTIFEGDIVNLFLIDGIERGVIKFNDIRCRFAFFTKEGAWGIDKDCVFEIIGNIHDNPELLRGGAE